MKYFPAFIFFFICVYLQSFQTNGYNILFFHNMATSSHRTAIWPLAEKLANAGHNVTYIFPIEKKIGSHPRIREITPSKMVPILRDFVGEFDINLRLTGRLNEWFESAFEAGFNSCKALFESPDIIQWLSEPDLHFDLIFIEPGLGECGYGFVHKFKAKHIIFTPLIPPFLYDAFGVVPETSSLPDIMFHAKPAKMGLQDRMWATLTPLIFRYKLLEFMKTIHPFVQKGLNLTDLPPLEEIERNASLVMINNYFVEDYSVSLPPLFQNFAGLWCSKEKLKASKPLPQDLANFVEKSDGFFYLSFGSAVVTSKMPVSLRNHFFNAFRGFPNRRFLVRWTGSVPEDTPKNALLLPWFPQQDILAHPKLIAFMTQTGRPSTQEALCQGVPLITLPIFGDQDYNADRLEYLGASINLDIDTLTAENLERSFREMLTNSKYRNRMKELSALFRDRPIDPLENIFYWTEFVMRHNTSILRPLAMDQTWYQRRLLDVYAAFLLLGLGIVGAVGLVSYILIKLLIRSIFNAYLGKRKVE